MSLSGDEKYHFSNSWFEYQRSIIQKYIPLPDKDKPYSILEIGSYEGRSTVFFLDNYMLNEKSKMVSIDPFDTDDKTTPVNLNVYKTFLHNLYKSSHPHNHSFYKDYSDKVLPMLLSKVTKEDLFDLITVDGSHLAKDVLFDSCMCWRLLKKGGYLFFDDYNTNGPKQAIDAFIDCNKKDLEIIHSGYHMLLQKVT